MSLKKACKKRTICEVLREINDELQGLPVHETVLPKLREAETMAKSIIRKLYEYNKNANEGFWKENPDYEADFKRRMDERYIT